MSHYLLDTSALFTLMDAEPGADKVENLLREGHCYGCFITQMEIYYRVWKDKDEQSGKLAYEQCLALPIEWVHETQELLKQAAAIKATQQLSLADAWIAASAKLQGATLVHKDPEFIPLDIPQLELPSK